MFGGEAAAHHFDLLGVELSSQVAGTVINARLRARGGHSRFERAADNSERESAQYTRAVADLLDKGWPVQTVDCTAEGSDMVAARIVSFIHRTLGEKSLVCP